MKFFIIFITFLALPFPLFGLEKGILFKYVTSSRILWKLIGDENHQPKYEGEIKRNKPHGKGTISYPIGNTYIGEFKDGKRWNGIMFDKEGTIIGKWLNGKEQQ